MLILDREADDNPLYGAEIHGFWTLKDLNLQLIYKEARERWLRLNEIHAMLCNSHHVGVQPRPRNLPESGTVVLFDRRVLENFRNDGHKWRTKRCGRGVMESRYRLKLGVGGAGIFVCCAYGADKSSFVRRCYWLDDEARANIVLVHYRETKKGASPLAYSLSAEASSDLINPVTRIEDTNFNMPHDAYGQTMGSQVNLSVQRNDPSVVCSGEISNIFPSDG